MNKIEYKLLEETLITLIKRRDKAWEDGDQVKHNKLNEECNEISNQLNYVQFGEARRFINLLPPMGWQHWRESNVRTREHLDRIALEVIPKQLPKLNENDTLTFIELVKAGVKPSTLFPNVSIKEAWEMVEYNPNLGLGDSELRTLKITYRNDITSAATDMLTYRWAVHQLEYLREIELDINIEGVTHTIYANYVVANMEPRCLPNGRFTAPQSAILALAVVLGWEIKQFRVNSECGNWDLN